MRMGCGEAFVTRLLFAHDAQTQKHREMTGMPMIEINICGCCVCV